MDIVVTPQNQGELRDSGKPMNGKSREAREKCRIGWCPEKSVLNVKHLRGSGTMGGMIVRLAVGVIIAAIVWRRVWVLRFHEFMAQNHSPPKNVVFVGWRRSLEIGTIVHFRDITKNVISAIVSILWMQNPSVRKGGPR
jgi:hypothetical protein